MNYFCLQAAHVLVTWCAQSLCYRNVSLNPFQSRLVSIADTKPQSLPQQLTLNVNPHPGSPRAIVLWVSLPIYSLTALQHRITISGVCHECWIFSLVKCTQTAGNRYKSKNKQSPLYKPPPHKKHLQSHLPLKIIGK